MQDTPKLIKAQAMASNLVDYNKAAKTFSWEQAAHENVDFFADGTLNIAFNCIDRHADGQHGSKTALLYEGANGEQASYTFIDLKQATNKFANVLTDLGVGNGERVFIFLPTIPERYVAFLGILKLGAIAGTMFAAFQEMALMDRLADSGAKVVVTNAELYPRLVKIQKDLPDLEKIIIVERGSKALPKADNIVYYEPAMASASSDFAVAQMQKDDYAYMLYTSGTTGKPKGIVHAHYDILQAIVSTQYVLDIKSDDIYWCTADIGWVTGVVYGVLGIWGLGGTSVIYEGRFSPENWYEVLEKNKVTVWYSAPTAIRMLMASTVKPQDFDLKSLRHLASVGEPLNPAAVWWSLEAFGRPFHDTWWQTELGSISIANYPSLDIKPGSMGKPLPGVQAAIIDDAGQPQPLGAHGNLALKTATVSSMMKTVWGDQAKFSGYFKGEWYVSGDAALQDEDGYFWFIGRIDDIINTAGERIGPFEVESALVTNPDVVEAGVIGKPDALRGEIIKAFVVVKPGIKADEALKQKLRTHVKQHLAGHAYPREIAFVDKLPKTRSGKIMRRILKAEEMGLPVGDTSTLENY